MTNKKLETHYAPAERADKKTVARQSGDFLEETQFRVIMEAMPHIVTILNSNRQIIYANRILLKALGLDDMEALLGLRPGEALDCIHSKKMPAGCGTSEFCSNCGAVNAIMTGLGGEENARECRITTESGTALDFMVWAKPLDLKGETFLAFSVADISHEKRRHALEKIFFHDILNTAGGVRGYAEFISTADISSEKMKEMSSIVYRLSAQLIDEINAQQQLTLAENNELNIKPETFSTGEFLHEMAALYAMHEVGLNRTVFIPPDSADMEITTDRTLLQRVVSNMVKNALEACKEGEVVTLSAESSGGEMKFRVHNPRAMSDDVQQQVFQRSFSTKARDRGLGTYSMKLLSTRYLRGDVTFRSTSDGGTTFEAAFPINI